MLEQADNGIRIHLKAVPGASRDQISGPLGDHLKVRVAAPPEGGKANKAIEQLLARALHLRPADVTIVAGHTQPEKTALARGITLDDARRALGL